MMIPIPHINREWGYPHDIPSVYKFTDQEVNQLRLAIDSFSRLLRELHNIRTVRRQWIREPFDGSGVLDVPTSVIKSCQSLDISPYQRRKEILLSRKALKLAVVLDDTASLFHTGLVSYYIVVICSIVKVLAPRCSRIYLATIADRKIYEIRDYQQFENVVLREIAFDGLTERYNEAIQSLISLGFLRGEEIKILINVTDGFVEAYRCRECGLDLRTFRMMFSKCGEFDRHEGKWDDSKVTEIKKQTRELWTKLKGVHKLWIQIVRDQYDKNEFEHEYGSSFKEQLEKNNELLMPFVDEVIKGKAAHQIVQWFKVHNLL